MEYIVRRGDQYNIPFPIILGNKILTPNEIEDVVISFNDISKSFKKEEVTFNWDKNYFEFPLTQEETFDLYPGVRLDSQVRFKMKQLDDRNPTISSFDGPSIIIINSNNEEII